MKIASEYKMNDVIKDRTIDNTNGYWCDRCECYHPYERYTKPTSTITKLKIKGFNNERKKDCL